MLTSIAYIDNNCTLCKYDYQYKLFIIIGAVFFFLMEDSMFQHVTTLDNTNNPFVSPSPFPFPFASFTGILVFVIPFNFQISLTVLWELKDGQDKSICCAEIPSRISG